MIEYFLSTKEVLRRDGYMLHQSIIEIAAENGHFDILKKYGEKHYYNICVETAAIQFGDLDTLKWCVKKRGSLSMRNHEILAISAAKIGNVEVLEYIKENCSDYFHEIFHTYYTAMSGNIKMLEFCRQNNYSFCEYACACALQNNDKARALKTLQWLRNHDCPWDERTCHSAVEYDNLPALKWAKSQGCPWDERTFERAAETHNISILEYCFENGCPMSTDADAYRFVMSRAMERKYHSKALDTLKWLHQHSCPWDEQILMNAASSRNHEAMTWAINNGCSLHPKAYYRFIEQGNIDVVEDCLQTHGRQDTDRVFIAALRCHDGNIVEVIQKLKLLRKYGYSWNENLCAFAAFDGHMRVLQWLKHKGCPWNSKTCEYAAKQRNLKMLKYAHENGCDLSKEAYAYCFHYSHGLHGYFDKIPTNPLSSHVEILEYLKENDCPVPNDDEWKLSPNGLAPVLLDGL